MAKQSDKSRPIAPGEIIKLGMRIRDTVTDVVGFAMYRLRFLQGCDHIGIAIPGVTEDGKMREIHQTDVLNFEIMIDQTGAFPPPCEVEQTVFLGDLVKDPITNREGIVIAYQHSLFDGPGTHVQPKGLDKDGKTKCQFGLEQGRVIILAKGPKHGTVLPYSEFVPVGDGVSNDANSPHVKPRVSGGPVMFKPHQRR